MPETLIIFVSIIIGGLIGFYRMRLRLKLSRVILIYIICSLVISLLSILLSVNWLLIILSIILIPVAGFIASVVLMFLAISGVINDWL